MRRQSGRTGGRGNDEVNLLLSCPRLQRKAIGQKQEWLMIARAAFVLMVCKQARGIRHFFKDNGVENLIFP